MDVCLLGHASEKQVLSEVQEESGKFGYRPCMWLGNDGDIPLLCSLLDKCLFYFGNDTGALHMSGALNRPVVGVYGGGTWPRFIPSSFRSVAFVQKLPCFGCNWLCFFSDAPCIRTISVDRITTALSKWLDSSIIQEYKEIDLQEFSVDCLQIIRQAVNNIENMRVEQADLRFQVFELTERLKESETDRQLRFGQVEELTERLKESESDAQMRFEQIQKLTDWLKESETDRSNRLVVINNLHARLESVEQEKQIQIGALTNRLQESEADCQKRIQDLADRLTALEAEKNAYMESVYEVEFQLKEANRKTEIAESAYHALENTFIVRKARQMRLIQVGHLEDTQSSEAEEKESDCESLKTNQGRSV